MAISSGINLQKLGVAATLFAQSFTFAGVFEEEEEVEVPPFGSQVIVKAEPISLEPAKSITHGTFLADEVFRSAAGVDVFSQGRSFLIAESITGAALLEEPVDDEPAKLTIIVKAQALEQIPQSYVQSAPWFPLHDPSGGLAVGSAHHKDAIPIVQSIMGSALLEEVDEEEPAGLQLIVRAEPIPQTPTFIHETFLATEVFRSGAGVDVFSQGRTLEQPTSITVPSLLEEPAAVDELEIIRGTIVEAEPIDPAFSFIQGTFLADNVELDILRRVIVEAQPLLPPTSVTQGFIVPEIIAPSDIPEGLKVFIEAEQPRLAVSITQGTFLADDLAVDNPSGGLSVGSAGHFEAQTFPQSITVGVIIEELEDPQADRIIVEVEPIPAVASLTRGFAVPEIIPPGDVPEGQRLLQQAEPIADAISTTLSGIVPDDVEPEAPPLGGQTIVIADPLTETASFVSPSITPEPEHTVRAISITLEVDFQRGALQPTLLGTFLADEVFRSAAGVDVFSQGRTQPLAQSITVPSLLIELAPEDLPEGQRAIVEAEPTPAVISITKGFAVPEIIPPGDLPDGRGTITTAEPIPTQHIFTFGGIVPDDVVAEVPSFGSQTIASVGPFGRADSFVLPSITPQPERGQGTIQFVEAETLVRALSIVTSGFVPPDVAPPEPPLQGLIVTAEPVTRPTGESLTRGFAVPEIIPPGDLPEGLRSITTAEPIPVAISVTLSGIVPDDVAPPVPEGRSILVVAQPIPDAISTTHAGVVPDNVELDILRRIIVAAEPIPVAISITRPSIALEIPPEPADGKSIVVVAEPIPQQHVFIHPTFSATDVIPIPEELQKLISVQAQPIPPVFTFTHAGVAATNVGPLFNEVVITIDIDTYDITMACATYDITITYFAD